MSLITSQNDFKAGQSADGVGNDHTPSNTIFAPLATREQDEGYPRTLIKYDQTIRVIVCRDTWQWIIQKQDKSGKRWRAIAYCRSKIGLERVLKKHGYSLPPVWPEHFESDLYR